MRSGVLDRRITIQRPAVVEDPVYGPQDSGWETIEYGSRVAAQKLDDLPSQTESVQGGLRMSGHPARIRVRYREDITSDMRIILHEKVDTVYEISSTPAEIGRHEWLEFTIKAYSS